MDILTQRLIALCNKIIAELRRLSDAVASHEEAAQQRHKSQQEQESSAAITGIRDAVQSIAQSQETAPKKWHKDRTFLISLAGVMVVGAYTFVTALQWNDANKNFRASQRPWVKIRLAKDGFPDLPRELIGKPLIFTLEFSNVGQTPARDVNIASFVEVVDLGKSPNLIDSRMMVPKYPIKGRIFNSGTFGFMFQNAKPELEDIHRWKILTEDAWGNHTGDDGVLTKTEWQSLIDGNKYVAIWSVATYSDIFDKLHWTAFCTSHRYGPSPGTTRACAEYNNADRN